MKSATTKKSSQTICTRSRDLDILQHGDDRGFAFLDNRLESVELEQRDWLPLRGSARLHPLRPGQG